jgi:hypothetical protein
MNSGELVNVHDAGDDYRRIGGIGIDPARSPAATSATRDVRNGHAFE